MSKLQTILDERIKRGAVYEKEKISGQHYNVECVAMIYHDSNNSDGIGYFMPSINDILYGDSNFREVMFPGSDAGTFKARYSSIKHNCLRYIDTEAQFQKMQSVLQEDKIEWLYNLLFEND